MTMISHRAIAAYTRRLSVFGFGVFVLLPACSGPTKSEASNSENEGLAQVSDSLTAVSGGSRILSDRDPTYALNAYRGAHDGGQVQLWQDCPKTNSDCNWLFRNGMIVSASDTSLAIKGGAHLAGLTLSATCMQSDGGVDPACIWTWSKGMLSNAAYPSLGVNAYLGPHQPNPSPLVSNSACDASNADCTWTIESAHINSAADPRLSFGTSAAPSDGSPVSLLDCPVTDPNRTWTFKQGMILSDWDPTIKINAWYGAAPGTELHVVPNCTADNPDCLWSISGLLSSA